MALSRSESEASASAYILYAHASTLQPTTPGPLQRVVAHPLLTSPDICSRLFSSDLLKDISNPGWASTSSIQLQYVAAQY